MTCQDRLKQAIRDQKVCWEVLPHTVFVDGHMRQIGFDLELTGTHSRSSVPPFDGSGPAYVSTKRILEAHHAKEGKASLTIPP